MGDLRRSEGMRDDRRLAYVRPPDWRNPQPKPLYDLVVIGGGTAGLVCAAGAAGLGARVALIEESRLGGDCLNTGCVPSKALLHAAREGMDFVAAMAHVQASREAIAPHDSAERLASLGIDVFFGSGAFTDRRHVSVDGVTLRFRKAVVATGSRPDVPSIPGLSHVPFLTTDSVFDLEAQPRHLIVLGGGPVGCELAQAFAWLGTRITLIEGGNQLLPREDDDAARIVRAALEQEDIAVVTGARVTEVTGDEHSVTVTYECAPLSGASGDVKASVRAAALLVATGRKPRTHGLGLDAAGIRFDHEGIQVDDRLRSTNSRVYAAGDVASQYRFTHAADALARVVIQNALFFGSRSARRLVIPWCTFTSPEVAHVGVNSTTAHRRGAETITIRLRDVDRAVVDDATDGFVRVHHARGRILGATIVGPGAGDVVGTVAYAMQRGSSLSELSRIVFPYPTLSLAVRQAADVYQRSRLTPRMKMLLRYYFSRSS